MARWARTSVINAKVKECLHYSQGKTNEMVQRFTMNIYYLIFCHLFSRLFLPPTDDDFPRAFFFWSEMVHSCNSHKYIWEHIQNRAILFYALHSTRTNLITHICFLNGKQFSNAMNFIFSVDRVVIINVRNKKEEE